jgi:hypothetical protein
LDPTSYQYKSRNCQNADSKNDRPDWASGCTMWGSGERNGLDNFHKACENFPEFCNGPDKNRNIMELASFLGNVTQETGDPTINSGLVYSAEMGSSQNSLFGKGALQLTGAINYQKATMGIDKELTGKCNTDALDTSELGACWENCVNSSPVKPPKGSGYNVCKEPSLASSNSIVGWSVSLWYWLNRPIATDVAENFFGLEGDIKNATAHNLIQNPKYNCDIWCPVTAIAQIGCPSCCVGKTEKLDPMTVNRVGGYVKIASILGLPLAQKSSQDQYFCKLLQFCKQGFNPDTLNCPAGISYQKYAVGDHWCGGVKFTPGKYFGNCVPTPGSYTSAEQCASCLQGSMTYWPCSATAGCKWDNKS